MAGNDHSGYPIKWFKDQNTARRFFECVICLEVLKDAVQVRGCGHQFCALCIDDILKANPRSPNSCPSCRIEISDVSKMVFEDHAARRMINELEVNCCNEGCTWSGCLGSLLQSHQNNCNFLIQRGGDNAQKLKLNELEQKHGTLMMDVFLFKEKHEKNITELKLKHEEDIKELKLKHQKDIGDLQMKHEKEKQERRDLQLKHEQERQVIREIKLKLQRMEDLMRRMRNEEKDLCEKEIPQKFSNVPRFQPVVRKNVKPVEIIPVQSDQHLEGDSGWEDNGEKMGGGITVKDSDTEAHAAEKTRIKYKRDFLLQFRYMPVCCEKPAGLPEMEVVLDAPVLPGKGGGSQRQKSQGGVKKRGSRETLATAELERSENPWQRPEERKIDLTKEEMISADLKFLPIENNDELLKLLCADQFRNDTVIAFIEKNFREEKRKEAKFINWLVTAVAESCIINTDEECGPECCKDKLKARKDILRKYLDNDITLELEALFAIQEIYVKYNKPAAMLSQFFNKLFDEEVLSEEAFMKWKHDESPSRQKAKRRALQATASFFEWLQAAGVEDPYDQPVMKPAYIRNVKSKLQATSAPFQPQYISQQSQYFNPGMTQAMYYTMPNNQQIQQQQNQQQQQPPAQTTNPQISATNANKPKPKRSSKIVIRDPKDHKDVTDEILSIHNNGANGGPDGTPPLTTSTA